MSDDRTLILCEACGRGWPAYEAHECSGRRTMACNVCRALIPVFTAGEDAEFHVCDPATLRAALSLPEPPSADDATA